MSVFSTVCPRTAAAVLLTACVWLAACDQAPGPVSEAGEPPVLSGFSFSPHVYAVPHDAEGDDVSIDLALRVRTFDPEDDVESVQYVVESPFGGAGPVATGRLSSTGGAVYMADVVVGIPIGEVGNYTVLVYAVDEAGSLSNEVRGMLRVQGVGEPPVILRVDADPEVVRPPTSLTLVATVTDREGVANIASVTGTAPSGFDFALIDDGQTFGDELAGDGRYTVRFEVDAATPGTQTFTFVATDLSGLRSDVFSKDIVVE